MRLYGYWRSSAAYRVRIALNLKKIAYQDISINLLKQGGEQHTDEFHFLNPNELVPVLEVGDLRLTQSLVILDYLDAHYPEPLLVPVEAVASRYLIRSLAQDIVIDLHPLNNLRVQQYLVNHINVSEPVKVAWLQHWIAVGFKALEERLSQTAGKYCVGEDISLVDVCLVPQVYNALRIDMDLSLYPTITRIYRSLNKIEAFIKAQPELQPDAAKKDL